MDSATIENEFKIAQVLALKKDTERAIERFQRVCSQVKSVVLENESAFDELNYVILSLDRLVDLYTAKEDLKKALAFRTTERKILEFLFKRKPDITDEERAETPDHDIYELLNEMDAAFEIPDAPPPRNPDEIARLFIEAKKKQDEEIARENLERLKKMNEERKQKLANSKWERFKDYISRHPVLVGVAAFIFIAVMLVMVISTFAPIKLGSERRITHSEKSTKKIQEDFERMKNLVEELQKRNEL